MRRVLIITHLERASPQIPGLVKYLPEFDWQPIILTPPMHERSNLSSIIHKALKKSKVIEVPYLDILSLISASLKRILGFDPKGSVRRQAEGRFGASSPKAVAIRFLLRLIKEVLYYPDQDRAWKSSAIKVASEYLQNEHVDAIISSSPPMTSHLIAKELKIKYKIPWIAHLRDLWTQNCNYSYSFLRKFIESRLELKTLSLANILITVSQPLAERLKELHTTKEVYSIVYGFDPEEANITTSNLTPNFTITFTGQLYKEGMDPTKLFIALRDLISEQIINPENIKVRFYGDREAWLEEEIKKYGLSKVVEQYERVSRDVALEKQRESQVLLEFNWENPKEKGLYSTKIFEYLAARRPIIAIGGIGNDVIEELLNESKAGFYAKNIYEIKRVLKELYSEYKLTGRVRYNGDLEKINKYTYYRMAEEFAKYLNRIISDK